MRLFFTSASFAMLCTSLGVLAPTTSAFSPAAVALVQTPANLYMDVLTAAPLVTKMVTGAALAVAGDALAQKCDTSAATYDKRRAASFAVFDMAYRALQHLVYPTIVAHFQGQYLSKALLPAHAAAPLERTLCSQLGIVVSDVSKSFPPAWDKTSCIRFSQCCFAVLVVCTIPNTSTCNASIATFLLSSVLFTHGSSARAWVRSRRESC